MYLLLVKDDGLTAQESEIISQCIVSAGTMEAYHKNGELKLNPKESPLQGRQKHVILPAYSILGHSTETVNQGANQCQF